MSVRDVRLVGLRAQLAGVVVAAEVLCASSMFAGGGGGGGEVQRSGLG